MKLLPGPWLNRVTLSDVWRTLRNHRWRAAILGALALCTLGMVACVPFGLEQISRLEDAQRINSLMTMGESLVKKAHTTPAGTFPTLQSVQAAIPGQSANPAGLGYRPLCDTNHGQAVLLQGFCYLYDATTNTAVLETPAQSQLTWQNGHCGAGQRAWLVWTSQAKMVRIVCASITEQVAETPTIAYILENNGTAVKLGSAFGWATEAPSSTVKTVSPSPSLSRTAPTNVSASGNASSPASPTPTPNPASSGEGTVIAAYWDTGDDTNRWTEANTYHPHAKSYFIANASSGPSSDHTWSSCAPYNSSLSSRLTAARNAGYTILGYVATRDSDTYPTPQYPLVPESDIKKQIDLWYTCDELDGIMFDNLPGYQASDYGYYKDLYSYVKAKHGPGVKNTLVVLNGADAADDTADYVNISDTLSVFESCYSSGCPTGGDQYFVNYTSPSWMKKYPPTKFGASILNTDSATMPSVIAKARANNIGFIYVTTDTDPNTGYTTGLPTYWPAEVAALDNE